MLGGARTEHYESFAGSLRDLIPDEHMLPEWRGCWNSAGCALRLPAFNARTTAGPMLPTEAAVRLMRPAFSWALCMIAI